MNIQTDVERKRRAAAIAVDIWENEGGALRPDTFDHHYGRRVEADRSWTVYHVFTGVPAQNGDDAMTGLSRTAATDTMMSMNRRTEPRRQAGASQTAGIPTAPMTTRKRLR